jgi:hypothetical protein
MNEEGSKVVILKLLFTIDVDLVKGLVGLVKLPGSKVVILKLLSSCLVDLVNGLALPDLR